MRRGLKVVSGAIILGILIWIVLALVDTISKMAYPLVLPLGNLPFPLQKFLAFIFGIVILLIAAYLIILIRPTRILKKIFYRSTLIRKIQQSEIFAGRAALVQLGDLTVPAIVTGKMVLCNHNNGESKEVYRCFLPSSPIPFTGYIVFLDPEKVKFIENLSPVELVKMITLYGVSEDRISATL